MKYSECITKIANHIRKYKTKYNLLKTSSPSQKISREFFFEDKVDINYISISLTTGPLKEAATSIVFTCNKELDTHTTQINFIDEMDLMREHIISHHYDAELTINIHNLEIYEADEALVCRMPLTISYTGE